MSKLPTGNLASSKKLPIAVVKNVSEKVAKVFGSDSDDEVSNNLFFFWLIDSRVLFVFQFFRQKKCQ